MAQSYEKNIDFMNANLDELVTKIEVVQLYLVREDCCVSVCCTSVAYMFLMSSVCTDYH